MVFLPPPGGVLYVEVKGVILAFRVQVGLFDV